MALPKLYKDFYHKKVFTYQEVRSSYRDKTAYSLQSMIRDNLGKYIKNVKKGLYYTLPQDVPPETYLIDKFLVANKLAPDAVIAYHAALELHGAAYSVFNTAHVLTSKHFKTFVFQGITYQAVLRSHNFGIEKIKREAADVSCTDRERTVIDGLDRIKYAGGLEEYLKSIEMFPYINFEKIEHYLNLYNKKALYAKVGFILSLMEKRWEFPERYKNRFKAKLSRMTYYLTDKGQASELNKEWNLMIPKKLKSLMSEF